MHTFLRQFFVALLGGAMAAGILLGVNYFGTPARPSIALAQTTASIAEPASQDADAPKVITYQGQAFNPATGAPLVNTGMNFAFRIYNDAAGTSQVYQETVFAQTNADGFFSTTLGNNNSFGGDTLFNIFNGQELYLGVSINNETLAPLQPITFVPYAFWSVHAHHLDNYDADDFPKIVAYGVINENGSKRSGQNYNSSIQNVAGSNVLVIDVPGVNHTIETYTTIVNPACVRPIMTGIGTSNGDLVVDVFDQSGNRTTCTIQFMMLQK